MHSAASCELKKGPWTPEEDQKLVAYIQTHGHGSWRTLPKQAGLARCGKSCRLRWSNYLRPGIKRGSFSPQEDDSIIQLHALLGNRWSTIATHLPGRTDNEIKNHWNTKLRKRLLKMGLDPTTHRPCLQPPVGPQMPSINAMLLSLLQQQTPKLADLGNQMDTSSFLKYLLIQGSTGSSHPDHTNTQGSTCPPMPNLPSSIASTFPTFDPTLLNAAQSYLMLEYLKLGSSHEGNLQTSNLDYQLNQVITQLVLVKLLQQQGSSSSFASTSSAYPRFDSKLPAQNLMDGGQQSPIQLSMDHPTYGHGIQSKPMAMSMHLPHGSTRNEEKSSYVDSFSPLSCVEKLQNGMPPKILTSMNNSAFQQRLLQAFPFLAESFVEPSRSTAMDDVRSLQIPQSTHLSISPSLLSGDLPLFNQKPMSWNANEVVRQSPSFDVPIGNGIHTNLMTTWDGPSISGVDGSKDMASSSTAMNTSSSSTISSASTPIAAFANPSTPSTNNINYVHDYWSSLLNLFSPGAPHQ